MKPIQLTMTAFGPYKETEVVDFRDLQAHRLFVISGKTGAGKTTIFDGICFALYGQASGEDRTDTKALRSQFADDSVQTTVELLFDIHQRRYCVLRQIPYRKKGNKSDTLGRCELYEIKEGQSVPVVDRQIVTEVNEKIEQLLGFTHAQFSQIMMLPQGEFRKFLTSDTANKEAIMRKIFKTEPYQKIVDRLKVKKEQAYTAYIQEKQLTDTILHQIPAKLPARETLLFTELASEHPNMQQVFTGLAQEQQYYETLASEQQVVYTNLYSEHDRKQQELYTARTINEQFAKLQARQQALAQLETKTADMAHVQKQLEEAERAALLEDVEHQVQANSIELQKKEASYQQAKALLVVANEKLTATTATYKEQQAKEAERTAVKEELLQLKNLLPTVASLTEQLQQIESIQKNVQQIDEEIQRNKQRLERQQTSSTIQKKEIKDLEATLEDYEHVVDQLTIITDIAKRVKNYHAQNDAFQLLDQHYTVAKQQSETSATAYTRLEEQWITNQAVLLAASLHEGEACPVCGSVDHPEKATSTEEQHVTKQQLDRAKLDLQAKEQHFHLKQAERTQLQQQIAAIRAELTEQRVNVTNDYEAQQQQWTKKVAMLRQNRTELKQKKEAFMEAEIACEEQQMQLKQLEQQRTDSNGDLETKRALYEQAISTVPQELREQAKLQRQIQMKEQLSVQLEIAWNTSQQQLQEARTEQTKLESRQQMEHEAVLDWTEKCATSAKIFEDRLKEQGFNSQASYSQVKLSRSRRQEMQQHLQQHAQQLHTLKANIEELQQTIEGKQPIEVEVLEQQVQQMKSQYERVFEQFKQSEVWQQAAKELYEQLETSKSLVVTLEETYGKVTNLYDVVRGQNRLKISFERYIQIEYLERIIQAANIRLRDLSNGQYELVRSDRQETRGKQSGLGIDVHDAYTGQTRDVKTLSGGEKFNASLCLALGMADVIQSFQGAVRMETMFIDEGFGALDEEAIQKAIDTLIALQQSGRMIGIISHIDEMKEAIPATLLVTKKKEGYSQTKFIIK